MTAHLMHYALGQARSGRWWWSCCRPDCDAYRGGLPNRDEAAATAERHQRTHDRRG